ncbi:MAG: hypothetical protein PHI88_00900 [Candidatus Pacebacteria bacterium]|nr:hypothetical protein [Candidatus Paceibacterota bacterium]
MKETISVIIFLLVVFLIFKGFVIDTAEGLGIKIPTSVNVFVSQDNGNSWHKLNTDGAKVSSGNISFNVSDTSFLFASNKGIFQSEQTKTNLKSKEKAEYPKSGHITDFIKDSQNPNIVYLLSRKITGNELFVSYDYGKKFQKIFVLDNKDKISVFKTNPLYGSYLYIGTENGLFLESRDGGRSWEKKKSFFPQPIIELAVNPLRGEIYISLSSKITDIFFSNGAKTYDQKVLVSKNGGNKFIPIKKLNSEVVKIIKVDSLSGKTYFASENKIFVLNGNNLTALGLIISEKNKISAFTINPGNSNILYIGVGDVLYITEDGGKSWQTVDSPVKGKRIKSIEVNPENPSNLLLTVEN